MHATGALGLQGYSSHLHNKPSLHEASIYATCAQGRPMRDSHVYTLLGGTAVDNQPAPGLY